VAVAVAVLVAVEPVVGLGVALVAAVGADDDGVQVGDAEAWLTTPEPTSGTVVGIGVPWPVGSSVENAENDPPFAAGVKVGKLNAVDAGHVLASSRNCTCVWPLSVTTMAAAPTSCAPGSVATKAPSRSIV
jgi:hypothetical protein